MKKQAIFALFATVLLVTALALTAQAGTDEIAYRNTISNMKLDFSNGNKPTCPFCGTIPDQWVALDTDVTAAAYLNGHYYLAGNRNHTGVGYYSVKQGESACLYLNGCDITSSGYPVFEVEGTLTVMGKGNLTGTYFHKDLGSTVDLLAGTLNLCGGTFQKADTQATPVIGMRKAGGKLNMYDGTVIAAGNVGSGNGAGVKLSAAATFNMYGGEISDGAATLGGNVSVHVADAAFYMSGGIISGGRATEMGGNIFVENGTVSVSGSAVVDGGQAPAGGNIAVVGAAALNIESGAVVSNGVSWYEGVLEFGGGGNIFAKDTNVTISGTISDGRANLTGGNIEFRSGILNLISGAAISGGQATYDGGNICTTGIYMNDCTISGGKADRNGDDVYVSSYAVLDQGAQVDKVYLRYDNEGKATLRVEKTFEGNVGVYNLQLPDPIYGGLLNESYYTCKGPFSGAVWLGDISDKPWLYSEGTQLRVASVSTFKDGQRRWYADNAAAVENYGDADYLLPVGDVELKDGQYVVDLAGQNLNITGTGRVTCFDSSNDTYEIYGSAVINGPTLVNKLAQTVNGENYVTLDNNGVYSFHKLGIKLTNVSLRFSNGGIYYTGRWECDSAVEDMIESFGVAVSLKDMPGADFKTDSDSMFTAFDKEEFENGIKKTGVMIDGIVKDEEAGADAYRIKLNPKYAKRSVYAKAYAVVKDSNGKEKVVISNDNIGYSLYSVLRLAEENMSSLANQSQDLKDFCAYWADYGLTGEDWEFNFDIPEGLKVGFGRANITPDYQVILSGGRPRLTAADAKADALDKGDTSTTDDDGIFLTCVAMEEGDKTYLIFTADLQNAKYNFVPAIRRAVEAELKALYGDNREFNIVFSTTHAHSSVGIAMTSWDGVFVDTEGGIEQDATTGPEMQDNLVRYRNDLVEWAKETAVQAMADLTPVENAYAGSTTGESIAFVRHYIKTNGDSDYSNEGGYDTATSWLESYGCQYKSHTRDADQQIQMVRFVRDNNKKDVVMVSVPTHGTIMENSRQISADYHYYLRKYVEENANALVASFMGAAGDQVPVSKLCDYHLEQLGLTNNKDYVAYGNKLGKYVVGSLDSLAQMGSTALTSATAVYNGVIWDRHFDTVEAYYEANNQSIFELSSEKLIGEYGFVNQEDITWTNYRYNQYKEQNNSKSYPMTIKVIAVGEIGFAFAPYEMSSINGSAIKGESPYETTFIATCTDETYNYVASEIAYNNLSYEAKCSWYGEGSGEALADLFVNTLKNLKKQSNLE